MKRIEVAAAVIIEDRRVFAAQRGPEGPLGNKWEFPGGKLETGESAERAVVRELNEELQTHVRVVRPLMVVQHQYPTFFITLHALLCEREEGTLILGEHQQSRWLNQDQLESMDWAAADLPIVNLVRELLDERP